MKLYPPVPRPNLVPRASDHWLNLETNAEVVITTPTWQLRGTAQILTHRETPPQLALSRTPDAVWKEIVRIDPKRLQIRPCVESAYYETSNSIAERSSVD